MVKDWRPEWPDVLILGVEHREYTYPAGRPWYEPESVIRRISPDFEGAIFHRTGYQTPRYISIPWLLKGKESLKFIKDWPAEARREAGQFLRETWRERRLLKEHGLL